MSDEFEQKPLQEWFSEKLAADAYENLIYEQSAKGQIMFFRDYIHAMLVNQWEKRKEEPVLAVSEHFSKSCALPVYFLNAKERGIKLRTRGNFYNWQVSVESERPVPDVFFRLFKRDESPPKSPPIYYCEGFKEEWLFGTYENDPARFTATLSGEESFLFTFAFLLGESLRERA